MFIDHDGFSGEDGRINPQIHLQRAQNPGILYIRGGMRGAGLQAARHQKRNLPQIKQGISESLLIHDPH